MCCAGRARPGEHELHCGWGLAPRAPVMSPSEARGPQLSSVFWPRQMHVLSLARLCLGPGPQGLGGAAGEKAKAVRTHWALVLMCVDTVHLPGRVM